MESLETKPKQKHYSSKLSAKKIKAIRDDYHSTSLSVKALAEKHGVSVYTINKYTKE